MGCGWDIERNLGGWLCLRQSALCTGVRWEKLSTGARGRDGNARRFHGLPGIRCGSGRNAKAPTRCWISRRDLCRTLVSRVAVLYACTEDRRRYRGWLLDRSEEHQSELQSLMRISYAV